MKIFVTQAHIDAGKDCNGSACPIALALIDAGLKKPHVTQHTVSELGDPLQPYYRLPLEAREFIIAFDRGVIEKPFEFELAVPA